MVFQWLQEVGFYLALARAVRGNLQNPFLALASIPLMLEGESRGTCMQHTVKYSMETPSWCIHMTLLSKEHHEIWKQSEHIGYCCARPCKFRLLSLQLNGLEAMLKLYCFWCWSSHEHCYLKEVCFTPHCTAQTCQPSAWTLKTCKTGTIVWPIKHTDTVSNMFWQYCKFL